jgi:hypothetical protein
MADDVTPATVARWMLEEIERKGDLFQMDAAEGIAAKFGAAFTYENQRGNPAIGPRVLKAFNKLTADTVVWEYWGRYWRKRQPGDKPGRSQK